MKEDLGRLTGYTEQMARRGMQVSTAMLETAETEPPAHVAEQLRLEAGEGVLSIRRLRGTSKVFPVVLLHSFVPSRFGLQADEDYTGSLYKLMEEKYRLPIVYADEQISARSATDEEAAHLKIAPGDPVLVMERVTYTTGDLPMEYVSAVYRPEHYTFSIRLKR
jgi:GntR family transcriptional regulator